jgi:hypothetical protein
MVSAPGPANDIQLVRRVNGTATEPRWSTLGRFRGGGTPLFADGASAGAADTSFGLLRHTSEYDWSSTNASRYQRSAERQEFSIMLTVHSVGPITAGKVRVLAAKRGEWRLLLNGDGVLEWHVHLASGWAVATGRRKFSSGNGDAFIVKATHSAGVAKVFSCLLAADFSCAMAVPEGVGHGRLPLRTVTLARGDTVILTERDSSDSKITDLN